MIVADSNDAPGNQVRLDASTDTPAMHAHVGHIAYLLPANDDEFAISPPAHSVVVPRIVLDVGSGPLPSPICFVEIDVMTFGTPPVERADDTRLDGAPPAPPPPAQADPTDDQGGAPRRTGNEVPGDGADDLIAEIRAISDNLSRTFGPGDR